MRDPRIEQTPVDKLLDEIQRLRDENEKLLRDFYRINNEVQNLSALLKSIREGL